MPFKACKISCSVLNAILTVHFTIKVTFKCKFELQPEDNSWIKLVILTIEN